MEFITELRLSMSFLSFIKHLSEDAAANAKKMEELIYEDPSSAITKARIFAEEILNKVFQFEGLEEVSPSHATNLFDRINFLAKEGILTPNIQNALHTVRLLGNKAAHQADYNDIVDAFKVHKALYNIALWFYETYSTEEVEIPSYTYPQPTNKFKDIEELIRKQVIELLEAQKKLTEEQADPKEKEFESDVSHEAETLFPLNLEKGESYLLRELRRLQDSSREAIENISTFSRFKKYLHVPRQVQLDLEEILCQCQQNPDHSYLILLCGSVGDGKSHLLAYLKENRPELLEGFEIFNDATESFSPSKNSIETLEELLSDFSDLETKSKRKVIIAINLGILHNFIYADHKIPFTNFKQLVEESNVFSSKLSTSYFHKDWLYLINFSDYQTFELTSNGAESSFFAELLKKICSSDDRNPFYQAYKLDLLNNIKTMAHYNYELLQSQTVQSELIQLIIQAIIKYKLVISARTFLNFVSDILIPVQLGHYDLLNDFERIENSLPFLLFKRKDRSPILKFLGELNPINTRNQVIDESIIQLNTLQNWKSLVDKLLPDERAKKLIVPFLEAVPQNNESVTDDSFSLISEALILFAYLTNEEFSSKVKDHNYQVYLHRLYHYYKGTEITEIRTLYDELKDSIFKWKGSPIKEYIFFTKPNNENYQLAQKLILKPRLNDLPKNESEKLIKFKITMNLAYYDPSTHESIEVDIDFPLFELLQKVRQGYCPNKHDEEEAIKFIEFMDKLMNLGSKNNELLVCFPNEKKFYKLYRDDFGTIVFEKEQTS